MSGMVGGRPGSRVFEPSYLWATSLRYQRRIVSGVTHDSGDVRKATTAKDLPFHGQPASLVVGEAQPSGALRRAEDAVLLEQVGNDRLLLAVDPAGEQEEEESERGRQTVHWWKRAREVAAVQSCARLGIVGRQKGSRGSRGTSFLDGVGTQVFVDPTSTEFSHRTTTTSRRDARERSEPSVPPSDETLRGATGAPTSSSRRVAVGWPQHQPRQQEGTFQ